MIELTTDFSRKRTLTGELVTLRPVTRADARRLRDLMRDPEVSRLTGSVHSTAEAESGEDAYTLERLEEIYGRWATAEDRIVWAIVERSTDSVVGESVLSELDLGNRACGFRIWISGARDRGLGTEAVALTMEHAFADQGLHRVSLEVFAFNPRARHVYEKAGFVHEGTRREALWFDGAWVDAHDMGLLEKDWFGGGSRSAGG